MGQNDVLTLDYNAPFSWVALDDEGKVIGEGVTLQAAEQEAKEHGFEHRGLLKVPPKDAVYIPTLIHRAQSESKESAAVISKDGYIRLQWMLMQAGA